VALVDCPECGKQVSTLALACPHCGFPLSRTVLGFQVPRGERGPSRWTDPGFWIIVAGLAVAIILSIVLLQHMG
jgi:predicted amidophosphoribosyltransferase